jgi:hypothetical protein
MITKARKAVSVILLAKAVIGFSVAALALFGVTLPYLGVESTPVTEGAAATLGGIIGVVVALRA